MFLKLTLLFFLVSSQDSEEPTAEPTWLPPQPKLAWPTTFHAWVVTTVIDGSLPPNISQISNKGQHIVFDMANQYSCRYSQQNLTDFNWKKKMSTDFCDYKEGLHFRIIDDKDPDTPCDLKEKLNPSTMAPFSWPEAFFEGNLIYHGIDKNADWYCNHYSNSDFELGDQNVQMDIWVRNDTSQYPCQISLRVVDSPVIVNWAFVAFTPTIPAAAKRCSAPRVICNDKGYKCTTIKNLNETDLYAMALHYACEFPDEFDCSPVNPGGEFYQPNDLMSHCDWVFNAYFKQYKMLYGEDACPSSVAQLIEGAPKAKREEKEKYFGGSKTDNPLVSLLKGGLLADPIHMVPNDLICL